MAKAYNQIKMESEGTEDGLGKGHVYYTKKNPRNKERLRLKKYNPIAKEHTYYKETK